MKKLFLIISIFLLSSYLTTVFAQKPGLEIGDKAPDISLPSPEGKIVTLSSLKSKVVLIDFWGTWCAPCVKEQPELAKLYKKYKSASFTNGKGFEIFGVSLDAKKENWDKGIKSQNINWIQVSDLKFWRSPVAKTYNIQELPFNLLLDGRGVILAKNLHGAELDKAISKFLVK
ncbi:MAG: TlpA disulfide reductase family protein [Mariniphaga sp.]